MPRRPNATKRPADISGKAAAPSVGLGAGHQFMPNFGMDVPLGINMKPALGNPGAPERPKHPGGDGKRLAPSQLAAGRKKSPGLKQLEGPPSLLNTPPPLGQKSRAGIPPPPSHGGRKKASLPSVKLNSAVGAESPTLLKSQQPLPKIGASKGKQIKTKEPLTWTDLELVLYGHITPDLPEQPKRLVRVFLSSTFSDMKAERNEIWTTVYPALRGHCLSHGLDFSFVDMRWGVLDYATDFHKTEDIVLAEVRRTARVSAATSFLSIIGHRYGSITNDNRISCSEFEILLHTADKHELPNRELLEVWYHRDDNNVPPHHTLQPISMVIPDYSSSDADKKSVATAEWNKVSKELWNVKYAATKLAVESGSLATSGLEAMEKSVTSAEIEAGILSNPESATNTYSIFRKLEGIEVDVALPGTAKFIDVTEGDGKTVVKEENLQKITKYINEPIINLLKADSRKKYHVTWHTGGIPTDVSKQTQGDREFLTSLSSDLTDYLTKAADTYVASFRDQPSVYKVSAARSWEGSKSGKKHVCTQECALRCALASKNALIQEYKTMELLCDIGLPANIYNEVLHHLRLAEIKTRLYCGRKSQLAEVKKYVRCSEVMSPLMIYGSSGSGKTPFAGQVAKLAHTADWLGSKAVVAVRFLGSSIDGEQVQSALKSILVQLSCAYQIRCSVNESASLKQLTAKLIALVGGISIISRKDGRPCLIILDGLEHLRPAFNTHALTWIPTILPPNIYFITTFNCDEYNLLSTVQARFDRLLELPAMTVDDMMDFVHVSLKHHNRTLTADQMSVLEGNLRKNPYPVYAQILVNLALDTSSYHSIASKLSQSTEDAINIFLERLEKRYGLEFVTHALAYITCGHSGLSEVELEDALSCSDEVLVEVYVFHDPPVPGTIRLPSHLWPMLRNELDQFIVEKATNDYVLLSWYHSAVEKVVAKRYLSDPALVKKYHQQLAQIYTSPNGVQRTITLTRLRNPITIENADRQVATFSNPGKLPVRILYSIIHHLTYISDQDKLKSMTVCNLKYISAIWQRLELKTMSSLTSVLVQELSDMGEDVTELIVMQEFYNNHLSSVGARTYCEEAMVDFCVVVLGGLSVSPRTQCVNSLLDQVKDKLSSWGSPLLVPTDQCHLFAQDKLKWQFSACGDTGDIDHSGYMISLISNATKKWVDTVDLGESKTFSMGCKTKVTAVKLSQKRVFALTDQTVYIQSGTSAEHAKTTVKTDSISKGEFLNKVIAVSDSARLFCLGGKDKIAVFEDKTPTADLPQYKAISSLNLGGVKSTEAIVFTSDESYTVSAHTIAAKNRIVGGLIKWNYDTKNTECRLSLPSPVLRNCMYLMPDEDQVLCACDHREVLIVSLKEQKILEKISSGTSPWIHLCLDESLLGLVLENSEAKVSNLAEKKVVVLKSEHTPTVVGLSASQSLAFVGSQQGFVGIYDVKSSQLLKSLHLSSLSIKKVKVVSDQYLVVYDADHDVSILSIEKLLEPEVDVKQQPINSLGGSKCGMFSSDSDSLLVERTVEEPASMYNTSDLSRIDIAASAGFYNMSLCGGVGYLVGEKEDSLGVWDLGKGQEVIPPPGVKELCGGGIPYHLSTKESFVTFASEGVLTRWNVADGLVASHSYIGVAVQLIRCSDRLLSLTLRSGSTDSWLIHIIDRVSGSTLMTEERDEPITDIQCLRNTALFLCSGTCCLMDTGNSETTQLELPGPVSHITSALRYYIAIQGEKTLLLLDGETGSQLCCVELKEKVSEIVFTSDEYTLVALPLGNIQLVKWQVDTSACTLSNKIQTTCGHLSASTDMNRQVLLVYGRLLDESRLFTFEMRNF